MNLIRARIEYFPLDCLGQILLYCQDSEIVHNMVLVSKRVGKYIKKVYCDCCKNVIFHIQPDSSILDLNDVKSFVQILEVEGNDYFSYGTVYCFPNLTDLRLENLVNVDSVVFKYTPRLKSLRITNCEELMKNLFSFHQAKGIVNLKITKSKIEHEYAFEELTNLEYLHLEDVMTSSRIRNEFRNLKKLTHLKIKNVKEISLSIFRFIGSTLQFLQISGNLLLLSDRHHSLEEETIDIDDFKFLTNINCLEIRSCHELDNQEKVLKVIGKIPDSFQFL